jgi:DNA (cytosine-5)-methyltransferase 1
VSVPFIELFCGIGGFRLGLEQARGFDCVWANDFDRHACQVYRKNFGDRELYEGDIHAVDAGSIPDHQLLTAGFPCQPFSVAGRRRGTSDPRGTLFGEVLRVLEAKRPQKVLLENVPGLLSIEGGETFAQIILALGELGYFVEWQVLDSQHFGVPQHRERVFIVGHLGGEPGRKVFPVLENGDSSSQGVEEGLEAVANSIDANYWKGADNHGKRSIVCEPFPLRFLNRNQRNFGGEAMTVDTCCSTGLSDGTRIRRLTPTECERLQGFPDGWTSGISDTQRYKCLGNAVTVNVIEFLGKRILESFA